MNATLSWLAANYPLLFILLIIFFVGWWTRGVLSKLENRVSKCEEKESEFAEMIKKIGSDFDKVRENIQSIKDYLVQKDEKAAILFSMKNSPRVLNENGQAIYNIIEGDKFIADNYDLLMQRLSEKSPTTALDVELYAKEVCIELLANPMFERIKNIVYNHPAVIIKTPDGNDSEYGFTIADACFVLSLPLRDEYLKAHPEIKDEITHE
ncbi:MAG: hypothetical protein NC209_03800 [Alistipes sp.]|nr:hypothetical protein [Alistipes sp.]